MIWICTVCQGSSHHLSCHPLLEICEWVWACHLLPFPLSYSFSWREGKGSPRVSFRTQTEVNEMRFIFNNETSLFLRPKQEEQVCRVGPREVAGDILGSLCFLPGKVLHVLLVSPRVPRGGLLLPLWAHSRKLEFRCLLWGVKCFPPALVSKSSRLDCKVSCVACWIWSQFAGGLLCHTYPNELQLPFSKPVTGRHHREGQTWKLGSDILERTQGLLHQVQLAEFLWPTRVY